MPRPYQAGERRLAATAATRSKIIHAARTLLADQRSTAFSIDAIADHADVARMTVYYQFKSKAKLLEALFDDIAERADMRQMRRVFEEPDLLRSLELLVEVFCRLWRSEERLLRRLTALAALDSDVAEALKERGSWRHEALTKLLARRSRKRETSRLASVLHAITSFETYASLRETLDDNAVRDTLKRTVSVLAKSY